MAQTKKAHTGNNAMMIIITIFWAIVVIGMAWQTWGFIDWLLPNSAWLMKALVLINFDIAAFIWFCIRNFFGKITRGGYSIATWGAGLDGLLSFLTTVFWFVIQYILKFNVTFQDGLITAMYVVAIAAFVVNALFAYFFVEIEWRFYHPVLFVDEEEDETEFVPQKPIIREIKAPNKAALARVETVPQIEKKTRINADLSTNKTDETTNEPDGSSTNKKKLKGLPLERRAFLAGGKRTTK